MYTTLPLWLEKNLRFLVRVRVGIEMSVRLCIRETVTFCSSMFRWPRVGDQRRVSTALMGSTVLLDSLV